MISGIYGKAGLREVYTKADHRQKRPILEWTGVRYDCYDSYAIRKRLRDAGFQWNPAVKAWWTKDEDVARLMIQYATAETRKRLMA